MHDFFNWLSVLVLLPLEIATGYMYKVTGLLIDAFNIQSGENAPDLLNVITDPITEAIIVVRECEYLWNLIQRSYFHSTFRQWSYAMVKCQLRVHLFNAFSGYSELDILYSYLCHSWINQLLVE